MIRFPLPGQPRTETLVRGWRAEHQPSQRGLLLQALGLCVDRGQRRLLDGIDLQLNPNEFVGILAPSGAGKTTLLKRLAGFLVPPQSQGRIVFDGRPLTSQSLAAYRATVGYVPQDDLLSRNLTGRQNLAFAALLRSACRQPGADLSRAINRMIERLGLRPEEAKRSVQQISGGQRRRLSVGVELLGHPRLLLLDEPTAGLDPASESRLMRLLQQISQAGTTVACSTHVLDNLNLFNRVIVLADRRVDFVGSPELLLEHYQASTFTELYERIEAKGVDTRLAMAAPLGQTVTENRATAASEGDFASFAYIDPGADGSTPSQAVPAARPESEAALAPDDGEEANALALPPGVGFARQVAILTARGFCGLVRDGWWLLLMLVSPVVIGGLINLSQVMPASACVPLTFTVVTAIWFGLTNSVREVVRDRKLYVRERLLGVRPVSYLAAKVLTFGLVGLVQVSALWVMVRYANALARNNPVREELIAWSSWEVVSVLWGCYLAALGLGLLISTLASSEEWAVAMLPLAILPQLLLTGAATDTAGRWFFPLARTWTSLTTNSSTKEDSATAAEVADAPDPDAWRWWVEGASLMTYSRPALDLLHEDWHDKDPAERKLARWDAIHLLGGILLTAALVWLLFRWRERHWLDRA